MRGQYRIINEMLIFNIGIILVVFTWGMFNDLQDRLKKFAIEEQLNWISKELQYVMTKLITISKNATIKVRVPKIIFDESYIIKGNRSLIIKSASAKIEDKFFKLGESYNITGYMMSAQIDIPIRYNGTILIGAKYGT